jgi:hypothetical protein
MDIFVTSVETIVELINRFNKILLRILVVIMELAVVHDNPTISMYPPTWDLLGFLIQSSRINGYMNFPTRLSF